MGFHFQGA
jgi:uncharacterized LabA/DUF88 family protein